MIYAWLIIGGVLASAGAYREMCASPVEPRPMPIEQDAAEGLALVVGRA